MAEQLKMTTVINASPRKVYAAWLDPRAHSAFTGSKATGGSRVGDAFTAWDGYILGVHLELEPGRRIVQSWRTSDFPPGSEDSRLEIVLLEVAGKTRLTLTQSNIPDGQAEQYREGWEDFYFAPLAKFVAARPTHMAPAAAKPRAARGARAKPMAKPRPSKSVRPKPKAKPRARKAGSAKPSARPRTRRRG